PRGPDVPAGARRRRPRSGRGPHNPGQDLADLPVTASPGAAAWAPPLCPHRDGDPAPRPAGRTTPAGRTLPPLLKHPLSAAVRVLQVREATDAPMAPSPPGHQRIPRTRGRISADSLLIYDPQLFTASGLISTNQR